MLRVVGREKAETPARNCVLPFRRISEAAAPYSSVPISPEASQPAGHLEGASFDELRERGRQAVESGRLELALEIFDEALRLAQRAGEQSQADLAFCNRSAVTITLGQGDGDLDGLRQILIRNCEPENCFAAAYNLSRAYELKKSFKKGLFYARIARDQALLADRDVIVAKSHNQIGNCLLAESYFDEAAAEYRQALSLLGAESPIEAAAVPINLGYCQTMLGDPGQGFSLAFRALRQLRRLGAHVYEVWPHLDLCYAYLEIDRLDRARRHGEKALCLAEKMGNSDIVKNALFLLGQTEQAAGRGEAAYSYFRRLQTEFFPDSPQVAALMLAVDMRQMINLRA